jgi:hypothetical protein
MSASDHLNPAQHPKREPSNGSNPSPMADWYATKLAKKIADREQAGEIEKWEEEMYGPVTDWRDTITVDINDPNWKRID